MKAILSLLITALLLSACLAPKTRQIKIEESHVKEERDKQQQLALHHLQQLKVRLAETSFPLTQAATAFCEDEDDQVPAIGLIPGSQFSYQEDFRETAKSLFNLDEHLRVMHVIPQSPADQADIQKHDRLVSVNDVDLPADESASKLFHEILTGISSESFPITIERNGEIFKTRITAAKACDYPVLLSESDAVNASADGSNVIITKGMMRFAQAEQELSLVVSHELAHNVMSHVKAKTLNSLGGTILDIAAAVAGVNTQGLFGKLGAMAYSQEFESEADYVGLYIMARAGLSTEDAAMFWRRMAVEHPGSINTNHASTHPATAERFIAIEKTIEQIDEKQQQGMALMPEMKEE